MRIIVTRPAASALRTAEKLARCGHEPVLLPLTAPEHDPAAAEQALQQPYSALAVTSAEAIRALQTLENRLALPRDALLFAVGQATAAAAQAAGFTQVRAAGGTGAGLARHILAHFGENARPGPPLLYLAGQPRHPDLEQALRAAGLPLRVAECYRMRPVAHDARHLRDILIDTPPDAVLFYSRENVRHFFSLPILRENAEPLATTRFFCLSRAVADALPSAVADRAVIAPAPQEDALLNLL